jgi:hypothetical protein
MRPRYAFFAAIAVVFIFLSPAIRLFPQNGEPVSIGNKNEARKILFNEQVVVTAVMSAKELKNCSDSLLLVSRPFLEFLPAANALSALGGLPGLFVQRSGDFGRADLDIRGLRWRT